MSTVDTYAITLYMAGDVATIKAELRRECWDRGLCVTVTPTTFIYTGGEEGGAAVGFINYPRFPSTPVELWERARSVADRLREACGQRSYSLVGSDQTEWSTR